MRKAPEPPDHDDDSRSSSVGLGDAALHALIRATSDEVRGRQAQAAQRALHVAELNRIDFVDHGVVLHDWTPVTLVVDGTPTPAYERLVGTVHAIVADLADVVLSVTGSMELDAREVQLVDVREHLDDYPWPSY